MRTLFLSLGLLLIAACSCQRNADLSKETKAATRSAVEREKLPSPAPLQSGDSAPRATANYSQATSALHAYLSAVAARQWSEADGYWTGGKAPSQPGDDSFRSVQDLRSLRIQNQSPKPLDEESPPRSIEIPVTLRVRKTSGVSEINGWYRMRRKVTDDGWEITSASMQPILD